MPTFTSIRAAADALRRGATTASALVDEALDAASEWQPRTNAFIRLDAEEARRAAAQADAERARGFDRGPLHGIPISVKDLIDVARQPTTAGSRALEDRIARADAPIVTRLREAGAVIIGKTNLHEFALGTTSEDSGWGPVRHPADPSRSAGGSSGGSAAAVATGMGLASIGTDTGGSIRIPAAACGVVGLKPTLDEVPTMGVVPLSRTLDHAGPIARTVQDAAWLWAVLAGRAIRAIASIEAAGLRLKRLGGYFAAPIDPDVAAAFEAALVALRAAGASITGAELPGTAGIATQYVNIVLAEGAAWHADLLAERGDRYTPRVRDRFESGARISAVDYLRARDGRDALRGIVDAAFVDADALILPTLPIVAPPLGVDALAVQAGADPIPVRTLMLKHTQLFNITGHPAVSIPIPVQAPGLPVGLQIVGRRGRTPELLAIGAKCEKILAGSP
jgi:aspartyl-tRNA(Asn)/glutamyl-tRNA(Gln) amidotransferase subunit A